MADQFQYPTMQPAEIASEVERSIGAPSPEFKRSQDYASYFYNQPAGDFGTAYPKSRRKIRMQEEFQKYQQQQLEQQQRLQQMEDSQRRLQLDELQYNRNIDNDRLSQIAKLKEEEDAAEAAKHAFEVANAIRGVTLPNGQQLRPIRPEDPDAIDRLNDIARMNPKFIENDLGKKIWESTLSRAEAYAQQSAQDQQQDAAKLQDWTIGQNEEAASLGIDASKFYDIDPQGNITRADRAGLSKAIGEAKRKDLEAKTQAALSSDLAKENRTAIKGISDELYKIGSQIRENDSLVETAKSSIERNEYIRKANYLRGEDAVLRQRLNDLIPKSTEQKQTQPTTQTTGQRPSLGAIFGGQ